MCKTLSLDEEVFHFIGQSLSQGAAMQKSYEWQVSDIGFREGGRVLDKSFFCCFLLASLDIFVLNMLYTMNPNPFTSLYIINLCT